MSRWPRPLRTRFRVAALFVALLLALSLAVRLTLLALHGAWPGVRRLLEILAAGEALDLLAALWLATPIVLGLTLLPRAWLRARAARAAAWLALGAAVYLALFVAAAEIVFFTEFDGRFNFVAVNYLVYPTEVLTNVWESYPTGWILLALFSLTVPLVLALRRRTAAATLTPLPLRRRGLLLLAYGALLGGWTWIVPTDLARFTGDRVLDEIGDNGPHCFWLALVGHDAPYQGLYATRPRPVVARRLAALLRGRDPGAAAAALAPIDARRPRNVVVVLEESLGADFVGALRSDGAGLTPALDALAREGSLWTRAYSTGNRTIRAIEATTLSIPPLPGVSLVQRARSKRLLTLPESLRERGYRTLFIYGGRALFDGMGSYLSSNGVERIVDQDDFPDDAFRTAWGVADGAIFDRALSELDALHADGRPFYALILTVSNHRPFHFPVDHVARDPALDGRRNAVRYADWALGEFMRKVRARDLAADTLFVLMGDHGARVYGSARIPLASYHVPILFFAPGMVPAERLDTLASSLDVPPTILAWLGLEAEPSFFGRALSAGDPGGRALMTHNNDVALLRDRKMAVLGIHQRAEAYACDGELDGCDRELAASLDTEELVADAIAYYQGADLLYRSGALSAEAWRGPLPARIAFPDRVATVSLGALSGGAAHR